jgi:hypothetical protein
MIAQLERRSHKNLRARLIARAWHDADFKSKLLGNPKAAIEQEFGVELPAEMTVTVVEDTPTDMHLALLVNHLALREQPVAEQGETAVPSPRRSHKDLKARLIARAGQDADFKSKLLGNPKATIEQEFGIELPAEMTVTVMVDTPTHLHFVLPVNRLILNEERLTIGAGTIVAGCSCSSCNSCGTCTCSITCSCFSCSCSSCISACSSCGNCGSCSTCGTCFAACSCACSCSSCGCGSCAAPSPPMPPSACTTCTS